MASDYEFGYWMTVQVRDRILDGLRSSRRYHWMVNQIINISISRSDRFIVAVNAPYTSESINGQGLGRRLELECFKQVMLVLARGPLSVAVSSCSRTKSARVKIYSLTASLPREMYCVNPLRVGPIVPLNL